MKSLIGRKMGMTQVFLADGTAVPVTVLQLGPCKVVQRKSTGRDGYEAVQLCFGRRKPSRVSKPVLGHYQRAGVQPGVVLREFRVAAEEELEPGQEVTVTSFSPGDRVDVSGLPRGRGFQGVVKRWGFSGGDESHGCQSKRVPGAIGQCATPSRTFRGQKLPGRMGTRKVTARNLKVVAVDEANNLLLVKGAVPGTRRTLVMVRESKKGAKE
jgi:large subunit ribosomal protein L3